MQGSVDATQPFSIHRLVRSSMIAICWMLLGGVLLCASSPASAQMGNGGAIRVESNEVLVPVLVLDKMHLAEAQHMDPGILRYETANGDTKAWESIGVRGLSRRDFRVFEDGREQPIVNVSITFQGVSPSPLVRDNTGRYREFVGIGGGTWTERAWEDTWIPTLPKGETYFNPPPLPIYMVAFMPRSTTAGSCHHVTVQVNRPDSVTYSRREYCDVRRGTPADPLNGTKLGKQLRAALNSKESGKTGLFVAAIPLFSRAGFLTRIVADFPDKPFYDDCVSSPEVAGVLGEISATSGDLVERFSDVGFWSVANGGAVGILTALLPLDPQCYFDGPFRYETQIKLPSGEYSVRVALKDGGKHWVAQTPLIVPRYNVNQLAISGIVLARRFRPSSTTTQISPTVLPENFSPLITKGVEVTPTANPRFREGGPVYFYFQVYDPQMLGARQETVTLHMQILGLKTGQVVKQLEPANVAPYAKPGDPVIPIGGGIDITQLPQGHYQLQAQATDSAGHSTAWRSVDFTIR